MDHPEWLTCTARAAGPFGRGVVLADLHAAPARAARRGPRQA
jgi:hypothetical protein